MWPIGGEKPIGHEYKSQGPYFVLSREWVFEGREGYNKIILSMRVFFEEGIRSQSNAL